VLHGLGLALVGCRLDLDHAARTDAPPSDAGPQFADCGTGQICLDLTHPLNAPLRATNGSIKLSVGMDKLILVRSSSSTVAVLSDICTHDGCLVNYTMPNLFCPCHGSRFSLAGAVLRGPANTPLKVYPATLAGTMLTITIA
jgi:cytochrome b6-f complex iron-sulfur subunit